MHAKDATPECFATPHLFTTTFDTEKHGAAQYQTGKHVGTEAREVHISTGGVWSARARLSRISSCEAIGYHANTADLLRGFIDSGTKLYVHRLNEHLHEVETFRIEDGRAVKVLYA